jgi:hypothetical protein
MCAYMATTVAMPQKNLQRHPKETGPVAGGTGRYTDSAAARPLTTSPTAQRPEQICPALVANLMRQRQQLPHFKRVLALRTFKFTPSLTVGVRSEGRPSATVCANPSSCAAALGHS